MNLTSLCVTSKDINSGTEKAGFVHAYSSLRVTFVSFGRLCRAQPFVVFLSFWIYWPMERLIELFSPNLCTNQGFRDSVTGAFWNLFPEWSNLKTLVAWWHKERLRRRQGSRQRFVFRLDRIRVDVGWVFVLVWFSQLLHFNWYLI